MGTGENSKAVKTTQGVRRAWRAPLIIGASGQVGTALEAELRRPFPGGPGTPLLSTRKEGGGGDLQIDLEALRTPEEAEVLLGAAAPDVIFCPGAMTYVDGCEDAPARAFQVNAHGPSILASYAASKAIPFVMFSSDYVFSGTGTAPGPYGEADPPSPISVYGESKLQGERAVLRVHPGALVIRTTWVYGPDSRGKNFITALRRQLAAGSRVEVPDDQVSTPTLNADLAAMTLALLRSGASGIVHVAGPETMSRLELARAVARSFALDETLIEGVPTSRMAQRARRPLHSGLRSTRLGEWTELPAMHVLESGLAITAAAQAS